MVPGPLNGIRIIDLSMGWAGPLAVRHAADMGADVIKIESCERFDWWRSWEATPEWIEDDGAEKSSAFNTVNRNKRNVTLDLEQAEGRSLLLRLVATANAVVENYSGGVLPKLGLGYEVFREVKADIILLSMPPFGSNGPWAEFRAYGSTVEHSSGLPHLNGHPEDPPTMHHVAYGDAVGGLDGASALLTALWAQRQTGRGQFVDLSQVEGLLPLAAHGFLTQTATGTAWKRQGNRSDQFAPHGVFRCEGEDSWLVLQVFDEVQWSALQRVVPGLDAFGDVGDRLARVDELETVISRWAVGQDASRAGTALRALGVPAAVTASVRDLLDAPHLDERGFWQWRERAVVGLQPNPAAPYRRDASPLPLAEPAPTLGQHNAQVLGELGVGAAELERLEALGVIGTKPRMPGQTERPQE